jgi:hypothetical protein
MTTTSASRDLELIPLRPNTLRTKVNEDDDVYSYYLAIGVAFLLGLILIVLGVCFMLGAISLMSRDIHPSMGWSTALLTGTCVGIMAVVGVFFLAVGIITLGISVGALYSSCCRRGSKAAGYQYV